MNKLFKTISGITLGLAMAMGIATGLNSNQNNISVKAATGDTTSKVDFTSSNDSGTDDQGVNWVVNKPSGGCAAGNYLKLYGGAYIVNAEPIKVDTSKIATMKIGARKFGGPSSAQATIKARAFDINGNSISNEISLTATTTNNAAYSGDITFTTNTDSENVFFRFTSSSNATLEKNIGVYYTTVEYTAAPDTKVNSMSLSDSEYTFTSIDGSKTISAIVKDVDDNSLNSGFTINWSSSNELVATVNNGVVTPVGTGTTVISGTISGDQTESGEAISADCNITVRTLEIDYDADSLELEDEFDLSEYLVFTPALTGTVEYAWTSSNTDSIQIDDDGNIFACDEGEGVIISVLATDENNYCYSASITFDVIGDFVEAASVELSKNACNLILGGDSDTISYYVLGSDPNDFASNQNIEISNASYVSIEDDEDGTLTISPISVGNEVIEINFVGGTSETKQTISITVSYAPVSNITIAANSTTLFVGDTATVSVSVNDFASMEGVTLNISDDSYADISYDSNNNWILTAKAVGEFSLTASINSINSNVLYFKVGEKINDISYTPSSLETVTAKWTASNGALGESNKPVSTITDNKGNVWNVQHTDSTYLGVNGQFIQVGSKNNPDNITLTCSGISGIVKEVAIEGYTVGSHSYALSVGDVQYGSGNFGTTNSNCNHTASGNSEGTISIRVINGSKAFYIKSFSVTYEKTVYGDSTVISNVAENVNAQEAVIEFAEIFMNTMEPYCAQCNTKDDGFRSAWNEAAECYDILFGKDTDLDSSELAIAKAMLGNATAVTKGTAGSDIVQNAVARYELILSRDNTLEAFMSRDIPANESRDRNFSYSDAIFAEEDSSIIILAATTLSAAALGALYLLKKKKQA